MDSLTQKQCNVCKEVKSTTDFYKDAQKKDGICRTCKKCSLERARKWSVNNAERARESTYRFRRKNANSINEKRRAERKSNGSLIEKERKYSREYYLKNSEKLKEYTRKWVSQNKEKSKKTNKLWRENNKARTAINAHNYRAAKSGKGKVTKEEWEKIKETYGYKCLRCGKQEPNIKLTLDHVVPISKGGLNIKENIQPLCGSCNSSKGDKTIDFRR